LPESKIRSVSIRVNRGKYKLNKQTNLHGRSGRTNIVMVVDHGQTGIVASVVELAVKGSTQNPAYKK